MALAKTVAGDEKDQLPINVCGGLYSVSFFWINFKTKLFRFCLFKLQNNVCTILKIKSDFAEEKKNSTNFPNFQSLGSTSGTWILGAIIAIPVLLLLVGLAIKLASQCSPLR